MDLRGKCDKRGLWRMSAFRIRSYVPPDHGWWMPRARYPIENCQMPNFVSLNRLSITFQGLWEANPPRTNMRKLGQGSPKFTAYVVAFSFAFDGETTCSYILTLLERGC